MIKHKQRHHEQTRTKRLGNRVDCSPQNRFMRANAFRRATPTNEKRRTAEWTKTKRYRSPSAGLLFLVSYFFWYVFRRVNFDNNNNKNESNRSAVQTNRLKYSKSIKESAAEHCGHIAAKLSSLRSFHALPPVREPFTFLANRSENPIYIITFRVVSRKP